MHQKQNQYRFDALIELDLLARFKVEARHALQFTASLVRAAALTAAHTYQVDSHVATIERC